MSIDIPIHYVETYKSNLEMLLQQKGSRLQDCVRRESQVGEREFYDRIAPTEANDVLERHGDTKLSNTKHDRRAVTMTPADWADMVDKQDKVRMLADPTSAYSQNAMWALGRKKDRRLVEAATGDAWVGKEGTTRVPFPASQRIAVDYVETGAATAGGLTIAKLRMAREMFDNAEIDDEEEQYIATTGTQKHDLLRTTEVTSSDYNTVQALVEGKVDTFMGFKFKKISNKILKKVGNNRSVIAWAKSGLLLSTGEEINVDIGPRRDKRNSIQVFASMDCGATRMEEEKVIEILCQEG